MHTYTPHTHSFHIQFSLCITDACLPSEGTKTLFLEVLLWRDDSSHMHMRTLRLAFLALTECCCFVSVLQMEVVSTFKRSGSFQGAVRRRSSVLSQLHDVNTISTPSHVALSTATANTSPAPGSESTERMYTQTHTHIRTHTHIPVHTLAVSSHTLIGRHKHCCTARGLQYFYSLWLCPLRLARCSCVCLLCFLYSFLFFPPFFKQHPVLTGCILLVWSGLVQIQSQSQCRVWCVVECWLVWEAARCSLSVWGVLTEMEQYCLYGQKVTHV